jgi:hypothetical protein
MIITETMLYKRLIQIRNLGLLYQELLPGVAAGFVLALATALDVVAKLAGSQKAAAGRLRDLSRAKLDARSTLRADLLAIRRVAVALAIETPGFDVNFQLPKNGDARLLAAARSFAELAEPLSKAFIKHALPSSFLNDLKIHIKAFERTSAQYVEGSHACDVVSAAIEKAISDAKDAATHLDAIARNSLTKDPPKFEAWNQACVSERAKPGSRKKPVANPVTPEVVPAKAA